MNTYVWDFKITLNYRITKALNNWGLKLIHMFGTSKSFWIIKTAELLVFDLSRFHWRVLAGHFMDSKGSKASSDGQKNLIRLPTVFVCKCHESIMHLTFTTLWANSLGKFNRPQTGYIFSIFSQKIGSLGDNLHEMSMPIFWESKKNILKCRLLIFFTQNAKCIQTAKK